jgi:hypothetical protein
MAMVMVITALMDTVMVTLMIATTAMTPWS